jgi:hypothetical protein
MKDDTLYLRHIPDAIDRMAFAIELSTTTSPTIVKELNGKDRS